MIRRGLRLEMVAGLGIALAMPALALAPDSGQGVPTTTTLTAGTLNGCSQVLSVTVMGTNGQPATGTVAIEDEFNGNQVQLTSAVVTTSGTTALTVALLAGSHSLTANFTGTGNYLNSTSSAYVVSTTAQCQFSVVVSNLTPATTPLNTLTAGQSGTATASVTPSPEFTATLTAPMFVTLSCSGLPDESSCTFTPENVEILPTTIGAITSSMVITTQAASSTSTSSKNRQGSNPIAWAFLLPGAFGLAGLAWGGRHRRWLSRFSLVALVGLISVLGTTACNPRYGYLNHGPNPNPATPAGTYTVTVTAQSSNGISAITQNTTFALTVQ